MKNTTTHEFKNAVRQMYAWPGGYALVFYTEDGGILCNKCAKSNAREIISAIMRDDDPQWKVVAIGYEAVDAESTKEAAGTEWVSSCDHCYAEIGECA